MSRPVTVMYRLDEENPGHSKVTVFIGRNEGARGNSGQLTLRTGELEELGWVKTERDWDQLFKDGCPACGCSALHVQYNEPRCNIVNCPQDDVHQASWDGSEDDGEPTYTFASCCDCAWHTNIDGHWGPHELAGPGGAKIGSQCGGINDPNPDCWAHGRANGCKA